MPPCKNDAKRSYTGEEPSPKGLGYCAHAEAEDSERAGRDGRTWVVRSGRWVPQDALRKALERQLYPWWDRMAGGDVMVIRADGTYTMLTSTKKTSLARSNDVSRQAGLAAADPNVVAIVWEAPSLDGFWSFLQYIRRRVPLDEQHALARTGGRSRTSPRTTRRTSCGSSTRRTRTTGCGTKG